MCHMRRRIHVAKNGYDPRIRVCVCVRVRVHVHVCVVKTVCKVYTSTCAWVS